MNDQMGSGLGRRVAQLFSCLVGRHARSRRQTVRFDDGSAQSRCRGCGRRMERGRAGEWGVARKAAKAK